MCTWARPWSSKGNVPGKLLPPGDERFAQGFWQVLGVRQQMGGAQPALSPVCPIVDHILGDQLDAQRLQTRFTQPDFVFVRPVKTEREAKSW